MSLHSNPKPSKSGDDSTSPSVNNSKRNLPNDWTNPRVPKDKLRGYDNVYKIKLRSSGYRLTYEVKDREIIVLVLKISSRDKIYDELKKIIE